MLDRFEADNPAWRRESERLGLLTDKVTADTRAERLHQQFVQANEKATQLDRRLSSY